jgi:hypothetical protein
MTKEHTAERALLALLRIEDDGVAYWRVRVNSRVAAGARAGRVDHRGYTYVRHCRRLFLLHRLIFLDCHGYLPGDVDHIDGDRSNNRIANLRAATRAQNLWNAKRRADNTSGVKNVSWYRRDQKWQVQVRVGGRRTHFGFFDTLEEAAVVAHRARESAHGEFARHA